VLALTVRRPRVSFPLLLVLVALAVGGSLALFHWKFLLLDAAVPSIGLGIIFTTMLSLTLAETERQRSALRRQVEQQRLVAARVDGELSAARRIQMGILPKPGDVLKGEKRFGLSIVLQPAREVGGDLYDFFKLDADRLFFMLGDVTGKGLAGSLFMVVSKSLYKSTALRRGDSVAKMMREANAEISRDNSEDLFVTVFAGVLDAQTGALEYCNAGHDRPYVLAAELSPRNRMIYDSKNYLYYYRLTPDRRMLFGGRAAFFPETASTIRRSANLLRQGMLSVYPQLQNTKLEYVWGGTLDFAFDIMPHAGQLDGLYYSLGYAGHGVAMATYLGEKIAQSILCDRTPNPRTDKNPFAAISFPSAPLGLYNGRPWFLPLAGAWYKLLDWLT